MTFYYFPDPMVSLNFQKVNFVSYCIGGDLSFSLQAKHTQEGSQTWGVNGETGALVDMKDLGIWEPLAVKLQTYKTAVEVRREGGNLRASIAYLLGEGNVTTCALECLGKRRKLSVVCAGVSAC